MSVSTVSRRIQPSLARRLCNSRNLGNQPNPGFGGTGVGCALSPAFFPKIKISSEADCRAFPSGTSGGALVGFAAFRDVFNDTRAGRGARG